MRTPCKLIDALERYLQIVNPIECTSRLLPRMTRPTVTMEKTRDQICSGCYASFVFCVLSGRRTVR